VQTVQSIFECTTEVKRSKFVTQLVPIEDYVGLQEKLKKQHPKANHVVYAVRYFNAFDQIVENFSDDHEPKGCAGMPALNVMRGEALINCAVLIVRYFGGIKLGTGGMARAYTLSVKNVIDKATLDVYEKEVEYVFDTSYSDVNITLYKIKQLKHLKYERTFGIDNVHWILTGSEVMIQQFKENVHQS